MFWPEPMIGSRNKRLGIRNYCVHPWQWFGAINNWVPLVRTYNVHQGVINIQSICLNCTFRFQIFLNEHVDRVRVKTAYHSHFYKPSVFLVLISGNSDQDFGFSRSTSGLSVSLFAPEISLIKLDNSSEFILLILLSHSVTDFLKQCPGNPITNTKFFRDRKSRMSPLIASEQKYCPKSYCQRRSAPMHNGTGCQRYLVTTFHTAIQVSAFYQTILAFFTPRTYISFGPANVKKIILAILLCLELLVKTKQRKRFFLSHVGIVYHYGD